jgi:hypothetical protein
MPATVKETRGARWSAVAGPWTVRPSMSPSACNARAVRFRVWRPTRYIVCSTAARGSGRALSKYCGAPEGETRSTRSRSACAETMTSRMLGVPAAYFHRPGVATRVRRLAGGTRWCRRSGGSWPDPVCCRGSWTLRCNRPVWSGGPRARRGDRCPGSRRRRSGRAGTRPVVRTSVIRQYMTALCASVVFRYVAMLRRPGAFSHAAIVS